MNSPGDNVALNLNSTEWSIRLEIDTITYKNKMNRVRQSDAIFGAMVLAMVTLLLLLLVIVMLKLA